MRTKHVKHAASVDEMVIRHLVREYMIRYNPINIGTGRGGSEPKGTWDSIKQFIKEAGIATGVILLMNNKDALTTFASKVWGAIKAVPETITAIRDAVKVISGSVTGPGGVAGLVSSVLTPESFHILDFDRRSLFEADAPPVQQASVNGPIYDTAYGGLLATIKVADAAKQNLSMLQASMRPIITFDRMVVDANMDSDTLERKLAAEKVKILNAIRQINGICEDNDAYPTNFSSISWLRPAPLPSIPGNDAAQTKIAKQVLSDSLAIAVYNSIKDDVIEIIKFYYDSINEINNDDVKNQFLKILKNFVKEVVGDIFENQMSAVARKILLPQ